MGLPLIDASRKQPHMYNAPPPQPRPKVFRLPFNAKKTLFVSVAAVVAAVAVGQAVEPGTVADIAERTQPFGNLCLEGQDCAGAETAIAAPAGMSGSDIYGRFCRACHETGLNDAPIVGDVEAWTPRLAKGNEELLRTTKEGLNVMPPMGLCMACSDAELQAAIDFMTPAVQPEA